MSINRGIDKEDVVWCVFVKNNKLMPFSVTWMDLESVILSEVSQKEKNNYPMASVICGI